jgi:hypothetical protein
MKIPQDPTERIFFYEDVSRKCLASRNDRRSMYRIYRSYYLNGCSTDGDTPAKFNKIYPHIDQLTSFLYAQETTRFAISLGASVAETEYRKVPKLTQAINDEWNNSNTDIVFGQALAWSLVYGSTFVKILWKGNSISTFVVDPHDFGVLREDVASLDRQEAVVHTYYISRSELRNQLENHPQKDSILQKVFATPVNSDKGLGALDRIITSAASPNMIGNVDLDLTMPVGYTPQVAEDLVEMKELHIWDDDANDYRVVTIADPFVIIYERTEEKMFVKGELPFIQVSPSPAYDYFWGVSEVERLMPLQNLRNDRMNQIFHMLNLQAKPPRAFSGFPGITDEINRALDVPGGYVFGDMPSAKVDTLTPQIPQNLFQDLAQIDEMFAEMSGITNVLSGRGEAGVRSLGHASTLARLGGSRTKKRALIVEDSLEKLTTLYLKLLQIYDKRRYLDDSNLLFVAAQFTDDFVVKVDAHSNSPIFVEDQTQMAFSLFQAGVITKERLLDLVQPPMLQLIKQDLKDKIEPAEAAAAASAQEARAQQAA